jgi:hypothetical protein
MATPRGDVVKLKELSPTGKILHTYTVAAQASHPDVAVLGKNRVVVVFQSLKPRKGDPNTGIFEQLGTIV